jgi:hypothetical protein
MQNTPRNPSRFVACAARCRARARVMAPHGQRSNERGRPLPAPWVLRMPASLRARALLSFIAREYRTDRCFMSREKCKIPPGILRVS